MKYLIKKFEKSFEEKCGWFFFNGRKLDRRHIELEKKISPRVFNTVAVTGGAGFIGSHLVKLLVAKGYNVTVIDSLTYAGSLNNLMGTDCNFEKIDIRNSSSLKDFFGSRKFDAILHLAAESHVDRSISDPLAFLKTNVEGTVNMLEVAVEQHRQNPEFVFYHVSTDEVFGSLGIDTRDKFNEDTPYDPRSPYSASKASSDHFVRAYHHTYNLPVLISNCSNNYGTHQYPEKLIPVVINKLLKWEKIPVYGNGINKRDWLHVEDHAEAILKILREGEIGETYCVGGNNVMSNIEVVHAICDAYDILYGTVSSRDLISYVKDRKGHDLKYAIDASKMRHLLGWKPKRDFHKGLREVVKWYTEKYFDSDEKPEETETNRKIELQMINSSFADRRSYFSV